MAASDKPQDMVLAQSQRLLRRVAFEMNRAIKSPQAEHIHDLRVSIRRFVQSLGVFQGVFHGKEVRKIHRRLKKLFSSAGEVRDCDIALKLLSKSHADNANILAAKLKIRRKECERKLSGAARAWMERKTSVKWRQALEAAALKNQGEIERIGGGVPDPEALSHMARRFFTVGHKAADGKNPEDLHEFRITAKKFRYTLELFVSFYSASFNGILEALKVIQGLLGDINDCETARQIISKHQGFKNLETWLTKRENKKIREFRQQWAERFGDDQTEKKWIGQLSQPLAPPPARKPVGRMSVSVESARTGTA